MKQFIDTSKKLMNLLGANDSVVMIGTDNQVVIHGVSGNSLDVLTTQPMAIDNEFNDFVSVIRVKTFKNAISAMNVDNGIKFEVTDKLSVINGKFKNAFQLANDDDAIVNKSKKAKSNVATSLTMNSKLLNDSLTRSEVSIAVADARYFLNGTLFDFKNKDLILVSTDGHRMTVEKVLRDLDANDAQYIVGRNTVKSLIAMTKKTDIDVTIDFNDNDTLTFTIDGITLSGGLVAGKFPDYTRVIPSALYSEFTHDVNELIETFKLGTNNMESKFKTTKLHIVDNVLTIGTQNTSKNDSEMSLDIEFKSLVGDDSMNTTRGNYNVDFIMDSLNLFKGKDVKFSFAKGHNSRPEFDNRTLVISSTDIDYKYVVMPMNG